MFRRFVGGMALAVFVMSLASVSYASETEALMKMLLKKGIITPEEHKEISGELKEDKEWKEHVDKHILHADETTPRILDGLSVAGGITMVGQGTIGNDKNDPPGEDVLDGDISADLEVSVKIGEHGEAFLSFEAGEGGGLDGDEIDPFWGVNADAGVDNNVRLSEAWYEHRFLDDRVTFTIGKLDLTNYFDGNEIANDETTQFLSPGFVNSVAIEVPDNGAAVRLTVSPVKLLDISVGVQSDGWEDIDEKDFLIGEVDIRPEIGGFSGNYRMYAWSNRGDHTGWKDASDDREHGSGYGVSIDQQAADFLMLFARAGYQDKKLYEFSVAWSGGLALSGSLWGRDDDVIGIAYGQAGLSRDYEDVLEADGVDPADEGHFEAYYSFEVNEHLSISPDIQVVTNAGGDDDFHTVTIGAVRGQVTF